MRNLHLLFPSFFLLIANIISAQVTGVVSANTGCGAANFSGSINISVNPPGAYTFLWSNGAMVEDLSGLGPGPYAVTVTNTVTGGTQVANFVVPNNPSLPDVQSDVTPASCNLANGSIDLFAQAGPLPFTYQWSNGQTGEDLIDIPANNYGIVVTGANGCVLSASITIPNINPALHFLSGITPNTTCSTDNGAIDVTITPLGFPYSFNWSNGATTEDLADVPGGTYSVTVTYGTCSTNTSFTVPNNPDVPVIGTVFPEQAHCSQANGAIALRLDTTTGGGLPWTFEWSNGGECNGLFTDPDECIQFGVPPGDYCVTATGANGCTTVRCTTVANFDYYIGIEDYGTVGSTICGSPGNGSINVGMTPPNSPNFPGFPYTFIWTNGATTEDLSNLEPGWYGVTATYIGTCWETAWFFIPDNAIPPVLNFAPFDATCGMNNGGINLSVFTGGVPPYLYEWSNGATSQDIYNIPADYYEVTVTGGNACTSVAGGVIDDDQLPMSVVGNVTDNSSCGAGNGKIQLFVNPASLAIQWPNGSTATTLNNLAPGDYTVTVSAGGTCTMTETFTVFDVSEYPAPIAAVSPGACGAPNGAVDLTVGGMAVPPFTYAWSNGATVEDPAGLAAGNYAVTVTSFTGCATLLNVVVPDSSAAPALSAAVVNNSSCGAPNGAIDLDVSPPGSYNYAWSGGQTAADLNNLAPGAYTVTVSLGTCQGISSFNILNNAAPPNLSVAAVPATCGLPNGAADASLAGGAAPFVFQWTGGAATEDLNNLPPGSYAVTVTDSQNCSASATVNIADNILVPNIAGVAADNNSCAAANGAVDLAVTPPGAYVFAWSNGAATEDLAGLAAGNFTVTVSLGATCASSATFTVNNNSPAPAVAPAVTPAVCGDSNGAIDLTISGPGAPFSFNWSNGAATEDLASLPSGNYAVTVSGANGCTAQVALTVPSNSTTFSLAGAAAPLSNCAAANGAIDLNVNPPGPYTFSWSNGAATEDLAGLPAGPYTVSVTDAAGCVASTNFIVADATSFPAATLAVAPEICGLANGGVDLDVSGGILPYAFQWAGGQVSEDLAGIPAGSYFVTVSGANGCTVALSAAVPGNSVLFSLNGLPTASTNCVVDNGDIQLDVTPPNPGFGLNYAFSWSNGDATEDLAALAPGVYTVTVSAGATCTNTATFSVADNTQSPALSDAVIPAFCGDNSGGIDLSVSGGQTPYVFSWSNGPTTEDLGGVAAGNYTVTVTDANDCVVVNTFTVPENTLVPALAGNVLPNTSCTNNDGAITLDVTPALAYAFSWSNGPAVQNLTALAPGVYTVTVSAGATCTNTATFSVADNTQSPALSDAVIPAFCGDNSGGIDLSVSGGQTPYVFSWSNGPTTEDLGGVAAGNYTVTITDANDCVVVNTFTVPENTLVPALAGNVLPNTSCTNNDGAITLDVTPALAYAFSWSNGPTTQNLTALAPGVYTVTVSAGGGCTAEATFTVIDNSGSASLNGIASDVFCFGENTGGIDLTVSGGTGPLVYNWSPAVPGNPQDPANLPAGNYAVTVTDALGCSSASSFTVGQPASAVQIGCLPTTDASTPGATDGSGAVNLTGGTGPYTLVWSPGGVQNNVAPGNFSFNNLGAGDYGVTITDANACTAVCAFTVGVQSCATAVGTMSSAALSLCGPGCLSANYNAAGQTLGPDDVLQFILHTGSGVQIVQEIARSSQPVFCFDASTMSYGTTYYVSVAAGADDGAGNVALSDFCAVVAPGTPLVFLEKPVAAIAPPAALSCAVQQIELTGSANLPAANFAWSTAGGLIVGNTGQAVVTASQAGIYTLIVTTNACSDTAAVQVLDLSNQPSANIAAVPGTTLDCQTGAIALTGTISGTSAGSVAWSVNGTIFSNNNIASADQPGVYEFTVLDTLTFCTASATIIIDENLTPPTLFLDPPGLLTCTNDAVTLSGGSPVAGILLSWVAINGPDTTLLGNGPSLTVAVPGAYYLVGIDPANGCGVIGSATVGADLIPPSADAGAPFDLGCSGDTGLLDGSGSSGATGLTFLWTTSDGNLVGGSATPTPEIDEPGLYHLLVVNPANGCTDTDAVQIGSEGPLAEVSAVQPLCFGDLGAIQLDTVIGGEAPVFYSIDNGQHFTAEPLFQDLDAGVYTILVQDANGCTTTAEATVDAADPFILTLAAEAELQLGEPYQIDVQPNISPASIESVSWSPATGLDCDTCLNPLATPLQTTDYTVTVVSEAGCTASATLRLVVDEDANIYVPNVFSPDGDGRNDAFTIFANAHSVRIIRTFQVFSRWGELVWEARDLAPNQPENGWDGRHRGKEMNPAVFCWYAIVELADGREELIKGDVMLER